MSERGSRTRIRFIAAAAMALACPGLMVLFSRFGAAFFPAYRVFSKMLLGVLSTLSGIFPISIWDILAVVLIAGALISLIVVLVRERSLGAFAAWSSVVGCVVAAILVLFVLGWGLNHYAPPLSQEIGLTVERYTTDELADATRYYLTRAAEHAPEVPRDESGELVRQDFDELARIAGASYSGLDPSSGAWPSVSSETSDAWIFSGPTAPVKPLMLFGEALLHTGHTGIFMPATGEANVPMNVAVADMPFTMCHEAAHRLAIAREQEANFAAFLACTESATASQDARFAYSGYYNAFAYCLNALYADDPELAQQVVQEVYDSGLEEGVYLVLLDRKATSEHYAAYKGPAREVGRRVNDGYLRTFGEALGIRSYGLVVDYLIAWYER